VKAKTAALSRKARSKVAELKTATIVDLMFENMTKKELDRETLLNELNLSLSKCLPQLEGDKVTFIGSTFSRFGEKKPYKNHCIVLNTCAQVDVENEEIEEYDTEKDVLLAWQQLVQRENPDVVIGYNIFGFDYEFMFRRAQENDCVEDFLKFSRNKHEFCGKKDYRTEEISLEENSIQIASGVHEFKYIKMNGRIQIDLYNYFRREVNLSSYKLDFVSGHYIGDYVSKVTLLPIESLLMQSFMQNQNFPKPKVVTEFVSKNLVGLSAGSYVHLEEIGYSTDYFADGAKFRVVEVHLARGVFFLEGSVLPDLNKKKIRWCLAKDDVTPKDIFRLTRGSAEDRAVVAKYCLQDCRLVQELFNKVQVFTTFMEMANICSVPLNFLVLRGQGIKLTSFVAKKCQERNTVLPVLDKANSDEGYEGAFVLEPKKKIYFDNPVACLDFASLYPSVILSENLSHDTKVWTKEYDLDGNLVKETGEKVCCMDGTIQYIYDKLPGYKYVDVTYDMYQYFRKGKNKKVDKILVGKKTCRFVQPTLGADGVVRNMGILPSILQEVLKKRKDTRKLIPLQTDEFKQTVFECRQLGYKLTANSLYGLCGAKTCTFYEKDIAACTTATGRKLLLYAKRIVEECYHDRVCKTLHPSYNQVITNAEYIYGDTDSVFFTFNLRQLSGERIIGKDALQITIELAQQAGKLASSFLKQPHDLEYEKTYDPFILPAKKKYSGILYELDHNKGKRKDMGNASKRRDCAPIVKDVFGGAVEAILYQRNLANALEYLENCLKKVIKAELPIDKFIISKALRSGYKRPQSIPHKVLADRIGARDPGNKPATGDRISYVYIVTNNPSGKPMLQGEKIETPAYIQEQNLKIDYSFYITNQIMKPLLQLFALVLEDIWVIKEKTHVKLKRYLQEVETLRAKYSHDAKKLEDKIEALRQKEVKAILFDAHLRVSNHKKDRQKSISSFWNTLRNPTDNCSGSLSPPQKK
jgi:DNA polymerase elongation subunit (family B)